MKILYKKLLILWVIFITMFTNILHTSDYVPLEIAALICNKENELACHLRNRILCKEEKDRKDEDKNDYNHSIISNTINSIVTYSNQKLREFLVERTKTCIRNACFLEYPNISNDPRLDCEEGAPKLLPLCALQEAVKDQLTAAFVCQQTICENHRDWLIDDKLNSLNMQLQSINYLYCEHDLYKKRVFNEDYKDWHKNIEIRVGGKLIHQRALLNVDILNTEYKLWRDTTSLIFYFFLSVRNKQSIISPNSKLK